GPSDAGGGTGHHGHSPARHSPARSSLARYSPASHLGLPSLSVARAIPRGGADDAAAPGILRLALRGDDHGHVFRRPREGNRGTAPAPPRGGTARRARPAPPRRPRGPPVAGGVGLRPPSAASREPHSGLRRTGLRRGARLGLLPPGTAARAGSRRAGRGPAALRRRPFL